LQGWAERPDGSFELDLCKNDNSVTGYRYKKVPQAEAAWDEGKITLTYLGIEAPSGFDSRREGGGAGEYEGYYEFYYHDAQDGHHRCYVYYPTTGRSDDDVQYSEWLD
jgi:hypothetical protein